MFLLVVGSTLLILIAIAHQSVRGHRYHQRLMEEQLEAEEALKAPLRMEIERLASDDDTSPEFEPKGAR